MKVPFLDLKTQYESIKGEIDDAINSVIESCAFSGGPLVECFEKEFADFCHCDHGIGVGNGTEALWLSLLALGIGANDEVITAPNTFIATAEAISICGAKPVFVDIDKQTYNLDPALLTEAITPNTKAIIPVHLFGQMADMEPIMEIAREHGLFVIEDACQAHGAEYNGKMAGSIGDIGCFSFYPGKNLGAFGEAGAIVTNNNELSKKIRMLRDHGQLKKYYHEVIGWNARMDGIQGAVLSVKLKYLKKWNEARRKIAGRYNEILSDVIDITLPQKADYAKHVYHIYSIRSKERDSLINALAKRNIHCGIHYPKPLHLQNAYRCIKSKPNGLPVAEMCAEEFASLPIFPEMSLDQISFATQEIKTFFSSNSFSQRPNLKKVA